MDENPRSTMLLLDELPVGAIQCSVTAHRASIGGRNALRVELSKDISQHGVPGADYIDMPTFVKLPVDFLDGTLDVDIYADVNGFAPDYARAFAGLAYRIADDLSSFEAVYLRPLNGTKLAPPPPRDRRALQYFAYPDWDFSRLRDEYPDGRFEAAAEIGPAEWTHLSVDVDGGHTVVRVNGTERLVVESVTAPRVGAVGLWVDIGTEATFSNLEITRR